MEEMAHYDQNKLCLTASNKALLVSFAQDIFNTFSFQNKNSDKIVNCFALNAFLGLPFPIGERIINCFKKNPSYDDIQLNEFLEIIEIFFFKDISHKEDFFFELIDFNKDGSIHLNDLLLFFKHLTLDIDISCDKYDKIIIDFFNSKSSMTFADFKMRTQNSSLVFMFYSLIFNMKSFNENVLQYYMRNIMIHKKQNESRDNPKSSVHSNITSSNENSALLHRLYSNSYDGHNTHHIFNRELLSNDLNYLNSIDTTISNNDDINDENDINVLNAFEDDKIASFDILKLIPDFPKIMIENNKSNSNNNIISINQSQQLININKTNKSFYKLKKSSNESKFKTYPYKLTNNSTPLKLGTRSEQLNLPDCLILTKNNNNNDKSSLYLEFNDVQNSLMANVKLVIVENYLFIFDPEYNLNYHILLLKHSFVVTNLDISLTVYSSKETEYKFKFPNKMRMQQFLTAFNSLNKENTIDQNYEIIEEIARSKYCKISLIRNKKEPRKKYCLKTLYNTSTFSKIFKWEAYLAKYLSLNPNDSIIQFYDVFESPKKIEILMEYFSIQTLNSVINKLTQSQCEEVLKQLNQSVNFLHSNGIIHRDLKLENILYSQGDSKIKVIDFGLSRILFPSDFTKEFCGTPIYLAPEMIKREEYNMKVDIWSLGIIAYLLEYKEYPCAFHQVNINQMYEAICSFMSILLSKDNDYWNVNIIRKIIKATLNMNPNDRFNSADLIKLFQ